MFTLAGIFLLCASSCCVSADGNNDTNGRTARQTYFNPYWRKVGLDHPWKPSYLPESHHQSLNPYFANPIHPGLYTSWNRKSSAIDVAATLRQNPFSLSNINSIVSPFSSFLARLPDTLTYNPYNVDSFTNNYEGCVDPSDGLSGICVRPLVCKTFRGRLGNTCGFGTVCCVNNLVKCGANVTVNNTYWQSPATVSPQSTCGVNLTLDNNLVEQRKKICQVRLDFVSLSIAQPSKSSQCDVDKFKVSGTSNKVPIICGDVHGQHMYLNLPSVFTNLQLIFTFGFQMVSRVWNIKISFIPCAPPDCLQYFTETSGSVSSFNWKATSITATRQLADQDYKICFRTEFIGNLISSQICFSSCSTYNEGTAFSLSGNNTYPQSQSSFEDCKSDYLILDGGFDSFSLSDTWDRYCGTRFSPKTSETYSTTVCSTVKPFGLTYRTNGDEKEETGSDLYDAIPNTGNIGFCFNFKQSF